MTYLQEQDMNKIEGGGVSWVGISIAATAIIIFLAGFIEGLTNPSKCN